MLAGNFFYINHLHSQAGHISADLEINAEHPVFDGHFPGRPVVPGVCMMQMVKELVESVLANTTMLISAGQLKFLAMIEPGENNALTAEVKYSIGGNGEISLNAILLNGTVTCFKMTAVLRPVEYT